MIDLPAAVQSVDFAAEWDRLRERVADYKPLISVVKGTWGHETLREILAGKVYVPDEVLNDIIAGRIAETADAPLTSLLLASHANGRLDIEAGLKTGDTLKLSGTIKEFVHKGDTSRMVYRVRKHALPGHGITSWLFSLVSLSTAQRLLGKAELTEALPVEIKHNTVTVDFAPALEKSAFARAEIEGCRLSDMLEIRGLTPKDAGLELEVKLTATDEMKALLKRLAGVGS